MVKLQKEVEITKRKKVEEIDAPKVKNACMRQKLEGRKTVHVHTK